VCLQGGERKFFFLQTPLEGVGRTGVAAFKLMGRCKTIVFFPDDQDTDLLKTRHRVEYYRACAGKRTAEKKRKRERILFPTPSRDS